MALVFDKSMIIPNYRLMVTCCALYASRLHVVVISHRGCASKQLSEGAAVGLSPVDVIKRVKELTQKLRVVQGMDELSKEAQHNATLMFFSLLRCMLASRRVLEEHKLSDRSFNWLLGEVETRFNQVGTQNSHTTHTQQLRITLLSAAMHVLQTCC